MIVCLCLGVSERHIEATVAALVENARNAVCTPGDRT
jgi:bacterioferritin-associated ferredoxin